MGFGAEYGKLFKRRFAFIFLYTGNYELFSHFIYMLMRETQFSARAVYSISRLKKGSYAVKD